MIASMLSPRARWMDVRRGRTSLHSGMSSKPTRARSSGTRNPASCKLEVFHRRVSQLTQCTASLPVGLPHAHLPANPMETKPRAAGRSAGPYTPFNRSFRLGAGSGNTGHPSSGVRKLHFFLTGFPVNSCWASSSPFGACILAQFAAASTS